LSPVPASFQLCLLPCRVLWTYQNWPGPCTSSCLQAPAREGGLRPKFLGSWGRVGRPREVTGLEGSSQGEVKPETCEKKAPAAWKPRARQRRPQGARLRNGAQLGLQGWGRPGPGRGWGGVGGQSQPHRLRSLTDVCAAEPRDPNATLTAQPRARGQGGGSRPHPLSGSGVC
jgi:hypothetical protein